MDRSFDLVALLKQQPTAKSHKIKPTQFVSVAGGVQKRLETNIKNRKTSRLSVFDRIRNISKCESPRAPPLSEVQQKAEHRKQQLEKWKEEKEKKKKEAAAQKKKPFVAGVAHKTTFGPPPPPKAVPSSSGRITRSQASRQRNEQLSNQPQSFAPSNASFKPPQFKEDIEVPTLAPISKKKTNKSKPNFTFEPILPKPIQKTESSRTTRSRTVSNKPIVNNTTDSKITRKQNDKLKQKSKIPKIPLLRQNMFQSSSSSDMEQPIRKINTKTSKVQSSNYGQQPKKANPKVFPKTSTSQSSSNTEMETISVASRQPQSTYCSGSSSDIEEVTKSSVPPMITIQQASSSQSQESTELDSSEESLNTPKTKVPKSESNSEEKLRSPKNLSSLMTPEQIKEEANNISPFVTLSRGKANARREMKKKLDEGLLDEDSCNIDSVNHFRRQLNSEITRLTGMCETWDKIFAQTVLPESVQELVLAAVGQARLLTSHKLQQFAGLVEACARPAPGAARVSPADLHGFWDMVFMQVDNLEMRFKQLEALRARGWAEERSPPRAAPRPPRAAPRPARAARRAPAAGGGSRIREMIAAARKNKKEQESQSSEQSDSDRSPTQPPEARTFEAGFFRVASPPRAPAAPATPANNTLLKSVLSSEARKASASKNSTSFAMLRASMMSKNVDIEGISPLMQTPTPINLLATPARSILKTTHVASARSEKLKTVLFCDAERSPSFSSCNDDEPRAAPAPAPASAPASASAPAPATHAQGADTDAEREREEKENKPTPRRRSRLSRHNAEDCGSPVMTRSRRKSAHTPLVEPDNNVHGNKRSARKKPTQDAQETPKRSSRRRKSTGNYAARVGAEAPPR